MVAGDGVDADGGEMLGELGVVDGPDVVFVAGALDALNEGWRDVRVGVGADAVGVAGFELAKEFGGGGDEGLGFAAGVEIGEQEGFEFWAEPFELFDHRLLEADDDDLGWLDGVAVEELEQWGDDTFVALELDVDGLAGWDGVEDLLEGGDEGDASRIGEDGKGGFGGRPQGDGLDGGEGGAADAEILVCQALSGGVVEADDVAVGGEAKVAFYGGDALGPGQFEGGEGVFDGVGGGPAMGDDEGGRFRRSVIGRS